MEELFQFLPFFFFLAHQLTQKVQQKNPQNNLSISLWSGAGPVTVFIQAIQIMLHSRK